MKGQFEEQVSETSSSDIAASPERLSSLSDPVMHVLNHSSTHSSSFSSNDGSPISFRSEEENSRTNGAKKLRRNKSSFAHRLHDHVKMGPKLSETVKGKLSLGAKIIQEGGRENIFKHIFGVNEGEELLKASQCYLSTTTGPIAGLIFISTSKVAFCSERSITVASNSGEVVRAPYKVVIPIEKIKEANKSENVEKPEQKYIEILTDDGFEFWFMGFLRYDKAFDNLQKAISNKST